ncbi:MAG: ImmA/IrrE family metallo-endopeptidase [Candidatus Eisenbacteria bacterium]|nr:ImmA/IrrE family metallo-endopeptidase [Candidatus Eisenbacteria bacterium]
MTADRCSTRRSTPSEGSANREGIVEEEHPQCRQAGEVAPETPDPIPSGMPPLNEAPPPEDRAYAEKFAREFAPLLDHWQERADEIESSFVTATTPTHPQRAALRRFADLCLRFANLEQRIEGTIPCEIPTHLDVIRPPEERIDPQQGETLAIAERARLGLREGPIENLAELLDERGIKVAEWARAEAAPAGAFLFDEDTGPALLALAAPGSPAARFLLAHAYAHLLADVDPYENRFCSHGAQDAPPVLRTGGRPTDSRRVQKSASAAELREARADRFARALLLPADHFAKSLAMFFDDDSAPPPLRRLGELAFYYGVETPAVLQRLADLGLSPPQRIEALAAELDAAQAPRVDQAETDGGSMEDEASGGDGEERDPLPARFVHLSLALFVRRIASRAQLGELLDLDPPSVDRMVAWLDLPSDFKERRA